MVFVELVTALHREGKTASQYLQELYQRYVPMFSRAGIRCPNVRHSYGYFQVRFA